MATKLGKNEFPKGHGADDFLAFGPPATVDGSFDTCKLADLGCFTQDSKDSNKFYHAAVVKSKINDGWFTYFEWGRTGGSSTFQFVECYSEDEAQREFAKQLHSKNDKRGEWVTIAGRKTLQAKAGEDCYLVRPLATRTTGLPDAKKIAFNDGAKKLPAPATITTIKTSAKTKWDAQTLQLMRDMNVGTVAYAKTAVQGGSIPTQAAIDEARDILTEAKKRIKKVGDKEKDQINDSDLKGLTYTLYSRVPKVKAVGATDWILNSSNIVSWEQDLDAFESALYAIDMGNDKGVDPLAGFDIEMSWIDPKSERGKFILNWMPSASRNKHGDMRGSMRIHNLWSVRQLAHVKGWQKTIADIASNKARISEKPLHQPRGRDDIDPTEKPFYDGANVGMLFHGSRSCNISGILRTGLRLPKQLVGVVITGSLLGDGAYFADDWKKSAGYCSNYGRWGGGNGEVKGRQAFMFIADTALGSPHVAPKTHGYTQPPRGCHSVFGKADFTDMGYRSYLKNNEWVVYDTNQVNLRYLVEFSV